MSSAEHDFGSLTTATRSRVPTPELRVGDVIHDYGLVLEVVEPVRECRRTPDGVVYTTRTIVLNYEQLKDEDPWLYRYVTMAEGGATWTVQGNNLARWSVVNRVVPTQLWLDIPT
jgi:hypothetical protein